MDTADNRAFRALTIPEAAARLAVSPATVRRLVRTGELPAARVGKLWRIRASAVDALLAPQAAE